MHIGRSLRGMRNAVRRDYREGARSAINPSSATTRAWQQDLTFLQCMAPNNTQRYPPHRRYRDYRFESPLQPNRDGRALKETASPPECRFSIPCKDRERRHQAVHTDPVRRFRELLERRSFLLRVAYSTPSDVLCEIQGAQ